MGVFKTMIVLIIESKMISIIMKLLVTVSLILFISTQARCQLVEYKKAGTVASFNSVNAVTDNTGSVIISGSTDLIKITNDTFNIIKCQFKTKGDNSTLALAIDAKNNIWTSTQSGSVGLYNGNGWQIWDNLNGEQPLITAIAVDNKGNTWAVGSGKLFEYKDTIWSAYTPTVDISTHVKDMVCQKDTIWLTCDNQGLVKYDGTTWEVFPINNLTGQNSNVSVAIDQKGNKWVSSTDFGIGKFDGYSWKVWPKAEYPQLRDIEDIYIGSGDKVWVCSGSKGISYLNDSTWENINYLKGFYNNSYSTLTADKSGKIWACSGTGVSAYSAAKITNYLSDAKIPGTYFATQFFDSQNRMWLSTYVGTTVIDSLDSSDDILNDVIKNTYCTVIKEDAQGTIWAGTLDGVWRYKSGEWTQYTTTDGLINNTINDISIDGENNVWCATMGGISTFYRYLWINYSTEDGLPLTTLSYIETDNQANVWVSGFSQENSISMFNGEYWDTLQPPLGDSVYILTMKLDLDNVLWLGTTNGLYSYNGNEWSGYFTDTDPASNISGIGFDPVNNLLLLNEGDKIVRFDGKNSSPVASFENFSGKMNYDNNGYLWGNNGTTVRRSAEQVKYLKIPKRYAWLRAWDNELTFNLISNSSWNISCDADWLNLNISSGEGNYQVQAFANENYEWVTRETQIEISSPGLFTQYLTVFQDPSQSSTAIMKPKNDVFKILKNDTYFIIEGDNFKNADLYNISGQKVLNSTDRYLRIGNMTEGIYFIKIIDIHNKSEVHKMVIQ